jgi:hypothetical protein
MGDVNIILFLGCYYAVDKCVERETAKECSEISGTDVELRCITPNNGLRGIIILYY